MDSLYGDAARRNTELAKKQEEYEKTKGLPKDSKYFNPKMDKYVLRKFDKEFDAVMQNAHNEEEEDKEGSALDFNKLLAALQDMSFLPGVVEEDTIHHHNLNELWQFLHGEEKGSV